MSMDGLMALLQEEHQKLYQARQGFMDPAQHDKAYTGGNAASDAYNNALLNGQSRIYKYMEEHGIDQRQGGKYLNLGMFSNPRGMSTGGALGTYSNSDRSEDGGLFNSPVWGLATALAGGALGGPAGTAALGLASGELGEDSGLDGMLGELKVLGELVHDIHNRPEWQEADISDVLGDLQVQIPDYTGYEDSAGGDTVAGGSGSSGGSSREEVVSENPGDLSGDLPPEFTDIIDPDTLPPELTGDEIVGDPEEGTEYVDFTSPFRITPQDDIEMGIGGFSTLTGEFTGDLGGGPTGSTGGELALGGAPSGGTGGGTGGGSGSGDGSLEGQSQGAGTFADASSVTDAEWTKLFPYTKLSPAQKSRLLPHINYIRSIR